MDGRRIGRAIRALRLRLGWRQVDLGAKARVSQDFVSRLERGRIEGMAIPSIDRVLFALDADATVTVRWRGGDLDRLLDRDHAAMNEQVAAHLAHHHWRVAPEVTYSEFGERGSIDLLAWHPATSALLVIEVKTELNSIEETLRKHDAKVRLARAVAARQLGWTAACVLRLLVIADTTTARDRVRSHAALFDRVYQLRGAALRRWLRNPTENVRGGLWFLRLNDGPRRMSPRNRAKRVRTPTSS